MNIEKAMIIKTNSVEQTQLVQKLREIIKATGNEVILVPHGVTDLWITVEDMQHNADYVVELQKTDDGYNPIELDVVRGFDSLAECWEYAGAVIKEAELPEDSCDSDVYESEGVAL